MSSSASSASNVHQQLRPRKSRCKTGCLCCRLRRKKCDEHKPTCGSCGRMGLICSYPASTEFAWRRRMGLSSKNDVALNADEPQKTPQRSHLHQAAANQCRRVPSTYYPNPSSFLGFPGMTDLTSPRLLQVYVEQIVPFMLSAPRDFPSPFLYHVLPMTFSDELIMNAVMALGGSTLSVCQPVDKAEERLVLQCYGRALKELKLGLTGFVAECTVSGGGWEALRLFLTIILLAHYEVIRGNEKGYFFHHLRAGRVFAPVLEAAIDGPWSVLVGVLLENYTYFELFSSLRLIPDDADIQATSQAVIPQLRVLRELSTFGVMLGDWSEIFQYVPEICGLAQRRKAELVGDQDIGCEETFQRLKAAITNWRGGNYNNSPDPVFAQGGIAAGMISQNALFLFLLSAYMQDEGEEYLRDASQPLVDWMIEVLPILRQTSFANIVFWPVMVTATYATTVVQRRKIIEYFSPFMPLLLRAVQILHWVWESPDGAFGLSGLARVIESHDTSYCFG